METTMDERWEKMQHTLDRILEVMVDIKLAIQEENGEEVELLAECHLKEDIFGEIPQRAVNALLKHKGVITFGDLIKLTEEEIMAVPGIGPVAGYKIARALNWRGLILKG